MSPPADLGPSGADAPAPAGPSGAPAPRLEAIGLRARAPGLVWHLAAAGLFVAAAATVLWQNHRAAMLLDLSYVLENAWRIAAGDVPYRDFPLPHAPGTFVLQALLITLFDASFMTHAVYCALIGGASAVITLKILEVLLEPYVHSFRLLALVMAAPLVALNVYAIYPHPFYDPDACFFVLLALWALMECPRRNYPRYLCFTAGALLVLPVFVKQNIGIAFFALAHLILLSFLLEGTRRARTGWRWTIAGSVAAGAAALWLLQLTAGLGNYWKWTVAYPARLPRFRVGRLLLVAAYMDITIWLWVALSLLGFLLARHASQRRAALVVAVALTAVAPLWIVAKELPWGVAAALPPANVTAFWPYLCALSILVLLVLVLTRGKTRFGLALLLPIVLVGTAEASFLSQGVANSTYGLFPLLVLLQGFMVAAVVHPERPQSTWAAWAFALLGAAGLMVAGSAYVARNDRLRYADVVGPVVYASTHPRLHGMRSSGEHLADLDRLLAWVDANVPASEPVMTIPGEDPFFYALRRRPRMPVLMFEKSTLNPYDDQQVSELVRDRGILWVVEKTKLQCCSLIMRTTGLLPLLGELHLVHEIGPYRIYRRSTPDP